MSDDATIDSGLTDGLESIAEDRFGDLDPEAALASYGITSLSLAAFGIWGWMFLNDNVWIYGYSKWFGAHITYFLPVGMAWLMLRFFPDADFLDSVLKAVTGISILGPFMKYW